MSDPTTHNEQREINKAEKSPARKNLELLEASNEYIFHGSPVPNINEFEPRQATNGDPKTGETWNDGPPGVAASEKADIAIFRSLINRANVPQEKKYTSHWNDEGENIEFSTNPNTIQSIIETRPKGYVYVFRRTDFHPLRGHEWRCESPAKPNQVIEVGIVDLPKNIVITD